MLMHHNLDCAKSR